MRFAAAILLALSAVTIAPLRSSATDETTREVRIDSPPMVDFAVRLPIAPNATCSLRGQYRTHIEIDRFRHIVLFLLRSDSPQETTRTYLLDCVDGEQVNTRTITFHTKFGLTPIQEPTVIPATPIPLISSSPIPCGPGIRPCVYRPSHHPTQAAQPAAPVPART